MQELLEPGARWGDTSIPHSAREEVQGWKKRDPIELFREYLVHGAKLDSAKPTAI